MVNQLIQDPNKLPKEYSTERLLSEFNTLGIKKGVATLKNLVKVNTDLSRIFANGSNIDESLIDTAKVKKLTQDIFMQGIHLLESTLEIAQQTSIGNLAELKMENDELLSELKGKSKNSSVYLTRLIPGPAFTIPGGEP
jgi:hypothetical protein